MQRKLIRLLKSSAAVLCTAAVLVTSVPNFYHAAVTATTTDYLNLRKGAGTNTAVILTLAENAKVTVLDDSNSQWVKVRTASGYEGYCARQYLKISGGQSSAAVPGASSSTAKTTTAVNMRTGSSLTSGIITVLSKGVSLKVLDNSNSQWVKVQTSDGRQGWCFRQYLSLSSSSALGSGSSTSPQGNSGTQPEVLSSLKSDTPYSFSMKKGATYTYKFTGVSNASYRFACAATNVIRSVSLTQQGGSYYLKIYAEGIGAAGVYASGGGLSKCIGVVTVSDAQSESTAMTVTMTDYLNLRQGPGQNYKVILTMSKGSTAFVLDNSNAGWVKVLTSDGKQGWCSREYVTISGSKTTPPSSNTGSDDNSQTGSTQPENTDAVTGATVTASLLRLREGAGTSYAVLDSIPQGTYLKVLQTPQSGWVKVQTAGGKTGYVSTDYVKLLYHGDTGSSTSGGTMQISTSSATVPQGKTLWLTASSATSWASSNPSVATVSNGYVTAVSAGTARITVSSGSASAFCDVVVTSAEPVRCTYASPNIAAPDAPVTLTAVTDSSRDGVQFCVKTAGGSVQTLSASLLKTETTNGVTTKVWSASTSFSKSGVYSYTALSSVNGSFSKSGVSSDVMIATQASESVTTSEQRRASDKMLNLIAGWEGYRAAVYADQLASSNVPTIGYGYTLSKNAVFYNNLSATEAWAQLVNTVNHASYTTELNKMIANNHFLMNQNQADALISFAYNVGSGYFNSTSETGFRRILKNAVVPPTIPSSGLAATVTYGIELRLDHVLTSDPICSISSGTSLTVTDTWDTDTKDVWYAVRLRDGTTGWVNSGYVNLSNSATLVHDLNYTNAYAFGTELILWNQAGGRFIPGLFYRRLGEANVFNYGDYTCARDNRYGYTYPASASSLA